MSCDICGGKMGRNHSHEIGGVDICYKCTAKNNKAYRQLKKDLKEAYSKYEEAKA